MSVKFSGHWLFRRYEWSFKSLISCLCKRKKWLLASWQLFWVETLFSWTFIWVEVQSSENFKVKPASWSWWNVWMSFERLLSSFGSSSSTLLFRGGASYGYLCLIFRYSGKLQSLFKHMSSRGVNKMFHRSTVPSKILRAYVTQINNLPQFTI